MRANLFPAILLAGPPHSGKSVLAYLLTQALRQADVAHYLLRAVPDGEGDWFLEGNPALARSLRSKHKTGYSAEFVTHMRTVIDQRLLPLLVDIGGQPQGDQFSLLRACTHSVLLYRTEAERLEWQEMLESMELLPVAELRSAQTGADRVEQSEPVLSGVITGLEREVDRRRTGAVFPILLERIAGICRYPADYLEQEHLRRAPFPALTERELGHHLNVKFEKGNRSWEPGHLAALKNLIPPGQPRALYGRGPVWLAAGVGVYLLPAPMAIYDIRYGWVRAPELAVEHEPVPSYKVTPYHAIEDGLWVEISLPGGILEPEEMSLPELPGGGGVALSGRLPRWAFAALARRLAAERAWVAVDVPPIERAVVIHSTSPDLEIGTLIGRQ